MNKAIVNNWNEVVAPDDDVYVLGDLMLNNNAEGIKLLQSLNGRLHIVRGNHDSDARLQLYRECNNVVEIEGAIWLKYNGLHFYLSHYPTLTSNWDYNKPLKARLINLCGHSHDKDKWSDWDKGLIVHCELDAWNNRPVLIDTIIKEIKEKVREN